MTGTGLSMTIALGLFNVLLKMMNYPDVGFSIFGELDHQAFVEIQFGLKKCLNHGNARVDRI